MMRCSAAKASAESIDSFLIAGLRLFLHFKKPPSFFEGVAE
jgi:hypothetical protein